MRNEVVWSCLLSVVLLGCQTAKPFENIELRRAAPVAPVHAAPPVEQHLPAPVSAAQASGGVSATSPSAQPRPSLLSLLGFGAAIVGALAVGTSGTPCAASQCVAARIIDTTAELEATHNDAANARLASR